MTTARLALNSATEVVHAGMPLASIKILAGVGKGFALVGEEDGIPMHKVDGKSYGTAAKAIAAACKCLNETVAWRSANG